MFLLFLQVWVIRELPGIPGQSRQTSGESSYLKIQHPELWRVQQLKNESFFSEKAGSLRIVWAAALFLCKKTGAMANLVLGSVSKTVSACEDTRIPGVPP